MREPFKVAVVGCGIGRLHVDAYLELPELFKVEIICDLDAAKARKIADEKNVPEIAASLDELCARDDLDIIDLCTPPQFHYAQIQQVLNAGKHVICEKPLVSSLQDVDALIAIEARSSHRVMPIFQYRYGHGLQKLKLLVDRGIAGDLFLATVETAWRRRADYYAVPWRGKWKTEGGGCTLGHATHAHDMLYYICGPARNVFARAATRVNPIEVEDCAAASLEMLGGGLATLSVTLGSTVEITRHRFCFRNLVAESHTAPYSNSTDPWTFTGDSPELTREIETALADFAPGRESFTGQFALLGKALVDKTELPVTLADARNALELITAIYYSNETRQSVDLPIGSDHPFYQSWVPNRFR